MRLLPTKIQNRSGTKIIDNSYESMIHLGSGVEDYQFKSIKKAEIIIGDTDNVGDMAEVKDWSLSVGRNNLSNQCQHPCKQDKDFD